MKKREEEIEGEEREGGELNLVPYLDIITNIVLFLLASIATGMVLGTINSTLPEVQEGASPIANPENPNEEPPVQLVVAVAKDEIIMFSLSGLEGSIQAPKLKIPAVKKGLEYDFEKLTAASAEIVKRRWGEKPPATMVGNKPECVVNGTQVDLPNCRPAKATEVYLMVDGDIPYQTVIAAMDALRDDGKGTLLFPGVVFSAGVSQ